MIIILPKSLSNYYDIVYMSTSNEEDNKLPTALELAKKRSKYKRKALIIGIDKYQIEGANLAGCKNDAKDFANTLLVLGFPPSNIKILTDERATKTNVIKRLEWLIKNAKFGDVLVYYQCSHGSQKTDLDNDEEGTDSLDEMPILHNFSWTDESTHLTDDDLYNYFTGKTPHGVRCEVILDTCFSGTGTRSLLKSGSKTARFLPPPLEQRMRLNSMIPEDTSIIKFGDAVSALNDEQLAEYNKDPEKFMKKVQHNTLWSASQEYQVAW